MDQEDGGIHAGKKKRSVRPPSRATEMIHAERLRRKQERLEMLKTLLAVWENRPDKDPEYIKELNYKKARLESQINVMAI